MCLKSRDQQVNHIYIQTAMCKPHGNNNPKFIIDAHAKKIKEFKHKTSQQ